MKSSLELYAGVAGMSKEMEEIRQFLHQKPVRQAVRTTLETISRELAPNYGSPLAVSLHEPPLDRFLDLPYFTIEEDQSSQKRRFLNLLPPRIERRGILQVGACIAGSDSNRSLSAYLLDEHLSQPLITGVEKHLIQLAQRLQVNPIHLQKLPNWSEFLF